MGLVPMGAGASPGPVSRGWCVASPRASLLSMGDTCFGMLLRHGRVVWKRTQPLSLCFLRVLLGAGRKRSSSGTKQVIALHTANLLRGAHSYPAL